LSTIDDFLEDIDRAWSARDGAPVELRVIGSTALFLQTTYERGTKDSDVVETDQLTVDVRERLMKLAGRGSRLHTKHRLYLDIVSPNVPLIPPDPTWHHYPAGLRHFRVLTLDVTDVVVSKLKRWSSNDRDDVRAMVERGWVDHDELIRRFRALVESMRFDARCDLLPAMDERIHRIESDWFLVAATPFEFPEAEFR
jgi:hypothetical protein